MRAGVLIVDTSGAPASYPTQTAVDAALAGDTILVKPGTYPGFLVDAKALTIVADPEGGATIEDVITSRDLPAGAQLTFSGFAFHTAAFGGLVASDMAAALRLDELQSLNPPVWTFSHTVSLAQRPGSASRRAGSQAG